MITSNFRSVLAHRDFVASTSEVRPTVRQDQLSPINRDSFKVNSFFLDQKDKLNKKNKIVLNLAQRKKQPPTFNFETNQKTASVSPFQSRANLDAV